MERLYVAPDGALYLVPFGLLSDPEGKALLETKDVRLIQTGRDLLRQAVSEGRRGMVALGGIDFDNASGGAAPELFCAPTHILRNPALATKEATGAADDFVVGYARARTSRTFERFGTLPGSES